MRRLWSICLSLLVALAAVAPAHAADPAGPSVDLIRQAAAKAIPLLERGSSVSATERKCFTCHNQAVPVLALVAARDRGLAIDAANLETQLKHTAAHLESGFAEYRAGHGQGGKVLTAGYALWTLDAGGRTADITTEAVTNFILDYQQDAAHWSHAGSRPPSSGSDFTATYVALRGLAAFGGEAQRERITARKATIRDWMLSETPADTEDRVFRLRSLAYLDTDAAQRQKAVTDLLDTQQSDGGWAQTAGMTSDAYATGTVLAALIEAGDVSTDHAAVRRGLAYLLSSQLDDGSWRVATRAKPFQTYYESGFPHGKDQFISIAASAWSTLALALALPEPTATGTNAGR